MTRVDILHCDDCPNVEATADRIRTVAVGLGIDIDLRFVRVETVEDAIRERFLGSPSVRVSGIDIDPSARDRSDFALSCRMYAGAGVPSEAMIVAALTASAPSMTKREHWEEVYSTRKENDVSWYQPHLQRSLDLILSTGIGTDARIIDVGGGASTLVDDLVDRGFRHVTVVDIAQAPLDAAKKRMGERARHVTWLAGDITTLDFPADSFDLWHDRAVFHFLTSEADRKAYLERVCCALRKGGYVVLATFGPEGPEKCSGLPVIRYSAEELRAAFGAAFRLVAHLDEHHRTPWGTEQEFVYCLCAREDECETPLPPL